MITTLADARASITDLLQFFRGRRQEIEHRAKCSCHFCLAEDDLGYTLDVWPKIEEACQRPACACVGRHDPFCLEGPQ